MRKLVSKEEEARKKKRNNVILGVFLALVMVLSTIGFALQGGIGNSPQGNSQENEAEYNGYKFVSQNGLWVLGNFVFKYTPQQVPNIEPDSGIKPKSNYQGKPSYVYSEDEEAEIEIYVNLKQVAQRVQKACPEGIADIACNEELPVKTCSDNFIIIRESNNTSIRQENNCVFIEGQKEQLTALADQFLFKTFGIR